MPMQCTTHYLSVAVCIGPEFLGVLLGGNTRFLFIPMYIYVCVLHIRVSCPFSVRV